MQGPGEGVEDTLGGTAEIAPLHPVVVVDADAGERCYLLAAQPGHAARAIRLKTDVLGLDPRSPRGEEVADLAARVHAVRVNRSGGSWGALSVRGTSSPLTRAESVLPLMQAIKRDQEDASVFD